MNILHMSELNTVWIMCQLPIHNILQTMGNYMVNIKCILNNYPSHYFCKPYKMP